MRSLQLQSERYHATGNLAAVGVLNQLGRPGMTVLSLLMREAVQNSWDARASDDDPVRFGLETRPLDASGIGALRTTVFHSIPENLGLSEVLVRPEPCRVLIIHDRGTVGLGGPTRADEPGAPGEPRDFVDFLRNVGQPPDRQRGGGTYGYGKAAIYMASLVGTVCVHTHCLEGGRLSRRFIAAALGPAYEDRSTRHRGVYTGRHWWGRSHNGVVDAVKGDDADELADMLGCPRFDGDERGTTILIVEPRFGDLDPVEAMRHMGATLSWNFWPKMISSQGLAPPMQFSAVADDEHIAVPDPETTPPLDGFVSAMRSLRSNEPANPEGLGGSVVDIASQRPSRHLGRLALQRLPAGGPGRLEEGESPSAPLGGRCHHVALMRSPELVVKYESGPQLPSDLVDYAGVFLASDEMDRTFARSEPPAHDDWVHRFLQDRHEQTYVRVALRRIREEMERFVALPTTEGAAGTNLPLAPFSEILGGLLPGLEGPATTVVPPNMAPGNAPIGSGRQSGSDRVNIEDSSRNRQSPSRGSTSTGMEDRRSTVSRIRVPGTARLEEIEGAAVVTLEFLVEHPQGSSGSTVQIRVGAVLEGEQLEDDPPAGRDVPTVHSWVSPDGMQFPGRTGLMIPSDSTGPWKVLVQVVEDAQVGLALTATPVFPQ